MPAIVSVTCPPKKPDDVPCTIAAPLEFSPATVRLSPFRLSVGVEPTVFQFAGFRVGAFEPKLIVLLAEKTCPDGGLTMPLEVQKLPALSRIVPWLM